MMLLRALEALGVPAVVSGGEPTSAAEYADRVRAAEGFDLPTWSAVSAARLTLLRTALVAAAWQAMRERAATASIIVTTSAGAFSYGLDANTQDNLQKALLGVLVEMTPNPRPWTPKGALAPIMLTHDDIKAVAGAVGNAYDAFVQAYLVHKAAIMALTTSEAVAAYDLTQGWPGLATP